MQINYDVLICVVYSNVNVTNLAIEPYMTQVGYIVIYLMFL